MTVMIVDDSPLMRKLVRQTLLQAGIAMTEVLEAGNGLEALTLLRARETGAAELRLILTDISMPQMNGLDFLEQMRVEGLMEKVPVVVITTEANESQVRRALAAGAASYIKKPFTAAQLKASVLRLVTIL